MEGVTEGKEGCLRQAWRMCMCESGTVRSCAHMRTPAGADSFLPPPLPTNLTIPLFMYHAQTDRQTDTHTHTHTHITHTSHVDTSTSLYHTHKNHLLLFPPFNRYTCMYAHTNTRPFSIVWQRGGGKEREGKGVHTAA